MAQQSLYFRRIGVGVLTSDALPCYIARKIMKSQGDRQTLFPGHSTVKLDLLFERGFRFHC
jgi:hypothetical protein